MIISPGVFFIFSKFGVFGKQAKNGSKCQKIMSVALGIPGTIHHMIVIYGVPV